MYSEHIREMIKAVENPDQDLTKIIALALLEIADHLDRLTNAYEEAHE